MTSVAAPICYGCLHKHPDLTCDAFPACIPNEIMLSEVDHRKPFTGDAGIVFEPKKAKDADYAEALFARGLPQRDKQPE